MIHKENIFMSDQPDYRDPIIYLFKRREHKSRFRNCISPYPWLYFIVGFLCVFSTHSFAEHKDNQTNEFIEIPEEVLADIQFEFEKRMTFSGHGVVYNAEGRRVKIDIEEAEKIQQQLLDGIESEKPTSDNEDVKSLKISIEVLEKVNALLGEKELSSEEIFTLKYIKLRAMAYRLSDSRRSRYLWRAEYLFNQHIDLSKILLKFDIKKLLDYLGSINFGKPDYIVQCRDAGVPIPPSWNISDSAWSYQGNLSQNILRPGKAAQVWTWADPHIKGGCVALPRGTGGASDVAGIICQNSVNGNACIWDNKRKGTGEIIPWATEMLKIADMQDATELMDNCTNCHSGNNVFLVSPDDPTWCRLLRGGKPGALCSEMDGPNRHNFTLQVTGTVKQLQDPASSVFHSTYTPLSGNPPRSGWKNNARSGCGEGCHLSGGGGGTPQPMPPICSTNCN